MLKKVVTPVLTSALDRTKTSDRNAKFVIAENLKSVGLSPDEVALNRRIVRRKRMELKQCFAKNLEESFKADVPLTVHWAGKMMFDISGRDIVD